MLCLFDGMREQWFAFQGAEIFILDSFAASAGTNDG